MTRLLLVTTIAITLRAFLLPFARHFRARGWQVDAMAAGVSSCTECRAAFDRVWEMPWSRRLFAPRNLFGSLRRLRRIVAEMDYDLVHVHTPVAAFVTRLALRNLKRRGRPKIIYTAHGFHFHPRGRRLANLFFLSLERLAGRWTDYLVVINREDEEAARRHGLVPAARVFYIPGIGVDTSFFAPGAVGPEEVTALRRELGLAPEVAIFTMVAEFAPHKRHRDCLAALARLCKVEQRRAYLLLAGEGPLLAAMERYAQRLGIAENVRFLGFRRDVRVLLAASHATILPSEREGLPRSAMESLGMGVPVIGTDIRGLRELLADGGGLLCPVGDTRALAAAMAWVLDHPAEAAAMGRKGRARVERYFALERILALYAELYERAKRE